jgi:hypothetical protein
MPRKLAIADTAEIGLDECVDRLATTGFDPADEESLCHAALALRQLGNNRDFLGDMIVAELARRHADDTFDTAYGPQVLMLARPAKGNCFLRANIWPSRDEHMMRASGSDAFVYGLPHDHNFSFLTLGYFGPGYWSDYYEFDYDTVVGHPGEAVALRHVGRERLEEGQIQLYRAHLDVHAQLPADALSVSVNIMHTSGAQGWLDQYRFDLEQGTIGGIVSHGASEAFLRIAVGLGSAEAQDLATRFAAHHPSCRMRLHALDALASVAAGEAARDALWAQTEAGGSRLVAAEARARRAALEKVAV